MNTEDKKSVN